MHLLRFFSIIIRKGFTGQDDETKEFVGVEIIRKQDRKNRMKLADRWEKIIPLLLLGLGMVLRFAYLGSVPGGMHQDEAFVAWNAYGLWTDGMDSAGKIFPVYLSAWGHGQSALYSWILIPIFALLGEENITLFAVRLPQAVLGTATLWVVYLLLKKMFGKRCGLWGLFLLAICPWHVMMCRWALDANLAPAFLMFGLYFFIRGLDDNKSLIVSAFFYGIGLYSYAVIWPIVPLMIFLQIIYGLYLKKLSINKWSVISTVLLAVLALPLILFVLINSIEGGKQIELPFMTIPYMEDFRSGELAASLADMWHNIRRTITLLGRQNIGMPYDILLPHGLFYDIGRVFIIIGFFALVKSMLRKLTRKEPAYEVFIFIQLIGAGVVCALVYTNLHQINCLYIPLVLCEAYGVWSVLRWLKDKHAGIGQLVAGILAGIYLLCTVAFQRDYYGDYKELVNTYFHIGIKEAIEYAMEQGDEIAVEKGAQWPRILFYSRTTPKEYLDSVVYAEKPAPAQFSDGENTFYINTDYENIDKEKVYIIYFPDYEIFGHDFNLTKFENWYVAVPK